MRVLQLIDSLRSGGAEQMAVSYANALATRIDGSYLVCTRLEGLLNKKLLQEVEYLFLKKKRTLDLQAFRKLRKYVIENQINIIQAHGSSWFLALMVKMSLPDVRLVWHDHWGERALRNVRPGILKPVSKYFDGVISVNPALEKWAHRNLRTPYIKYLPNFLSKDKTGNRSSVEDNDVLKGNRNSLKIICLANIRSQKDHMTLLKSFNMVNQKCPNTSLHLVGNDENNSYVQELKDFLKVKQLEEKVFFYGEQGDVNKFLKEADIGILSSKTEGLPLALLEYGLNHLAVVCTNVGECEEIIQNCGFLVPPESPLHMSKAILDYVNNPEIRKEYAEAFHSRITKNFSEVHVMKRVIHFFSQIENLK